VARAGEGQQDAGSEGGQDEGARDQNQSKQDERNDDQEHQRSKQNKTSELPRPEAVAFGRPAIHEFPPADPKVDLRTPSCGRPVHHSAR
jgi:hypothetical protein